MEHARQLVIDQGWTPQEKYRRKGIPYLYAVRRDSEANKIVWKYIAPASRLEQMTEDEIINKLK